jgi:hypothetical protein
VLFNQVSVGITNNFSVGIGMVRFSFCRAATPVWIAPKLSIPVKKDKFNLGAGALVATVIGEGEGGGFGILYGLATTGSRDNNLSLGLGYGYAGGDWADSPTISLSGMARTGARDTWLMKIIISIWAERDYCCCSRPDSDG